MEINFIFSLAVIIISIVVHEVSHGYVAYFLGDPTAKYAGRLTLNPIKHMELFGSVIVPIITSLLPGGIVFGWAKPVPFNPYNLTKRIWGLPAQAGEAIVAIAGPASNFFIAIIFGIILRYLNIGVSSVYFPIINLIIVANITLGVFNLMPIPPLDGSKILFALIPSHIWQVRQWIEKNTLILILVFIFFAGAIISPLIEIVYRLITGF